AEDGIRDYKVTGVQTCALPISDRAEQGLMMLPVLSGLRVIAVEQYGAGPYGSMQLADLGAEIIKIENPADGGDMARRVGPFFFRSEERRVGKEWRRGWARCG